MAKSSVRDVDRGLNGLLRRAGFKVKVRVGVFGDLAAQAAVDGDGATVGDIASAHEFGHGPPERSFVRAPIADNLPKIESATRKAAEAFLTGKMPETQAADLIGHGVAGMMRKAVTAGIAPALSPRYLPRKLSKYPGASTPLIASGQLLGSITHAVDKGGSK